MNSREAISLRNSGDNSAIRDARHQESALSFCREERERRLAESSRKGPPRHSALRRRIAFLPSCRRPSSLSLSERRVAERREGLSEIAGDKDRHLTSAFRESENRGAKRQGGETQRGAADREEDDDDGILRAIAPPGNEPSRVTIRHARVCTNPEHCVSLYAHRDHFSPIRCRYHPRVSRARIYSNFYRSADRLDPFFYIFKYMTNNHTFCFPPKVL